MNDIKSSGMKFSPNVTNHSTVRAAKHKDTRDWTDKMFQDFNVETGAVEAINVNIIDCAGQSTLGHVNVGNDNISILVDFANDVDTSAMLKNEDIIVLGGNRAGRGGQGRLYVPVSQFEKFLQHCAALYESISNQLPELRNAVRAGRNPASNEQGSMDSDDFME